MCLLCSSFKITEIHLMKRTQLLERRLSTTMTTNKITGSWKEGCPKFMLSSVSLSCMEGGKPPLQISFIHWNISACYSQSHPPGKETVFEACAHSFRSGRKAKSYYINSTSACHFSTMYIFSKTQNAVKLNEEEKIILIKKKKKIWNREKFEPIHPFSSSKSFLEDPWPKIKQSKPLVIRFKFTDSILHFHCTDMYTYKEAEKMSVCEMNSKPWLSVAVSFYK